MTNTHLFGNLVRDLACYSTSAHTKRYHRTHHQYGGLKHLICFASFSCSTLVPASSTTIPGKPSEQIAYLYPRPTSTKTLTCTSSSCKLASCLTGIRSLTAFLHHSATFRTTHQSKFSCFSTTESAKDRSLPATAIGHQHVPSILPSYRQSTAFPIPLRS
jgi:hypothetical protein